MIDVQALSVCLRVCAAFHEDEGKVLVANVPQRAKSIGDFTLLITTMGTLTIFCFQHYVRSLTVVGEVKSRRWVNRIKYDDDEFTDRVQVSKYYDSAF
jgi:hypothetical protein